MSHYFLVSMVIVRSLFCNSQTLHSRSCDWLFAHDPNLHPTDKHSYSCLFLDSFTQVRLQEILSGSGYNFSSFHLNIDKLLLVLGHCDNEWFDHDFYIQDEDGCQIKIGSEWQTILGHRQLIKCMGICVLSLAHGSELRGPDVYLHIVKKSSGNFSLNSALGGLCLEVFQEFSPFF